MKYRWNCREGLLKSRLTCACFARVDQLPTPHPLTPTNTCKGSTTSKGKKKVNISQAALQCFSGDVRNANGCHRPDQSPTEGVVDAVEVCKNRANVQQHFSPGSRLSTCNTAGWSSRQVSTGSCHIFCTDGIPVLISSVLCFIQPKSITQ